MGSQTGDVWGRENQGYESGAQEPIRCPLGVIAEQVGDSAARVVGAALRAVPLSVRGNQELRLSPGKHQHFRIGGEAGAI